LKSIFQQALNSTGKAEKPNHELAVQVLSLQDRAIGLDFGERPADASRNSLFDLLHSRLASQAMQLSVKFTNWVHELVDDSSAGVQAARFSADAGRNYLRDLIGSLRKEVHEIHKRQIEARIQLTSPSQWGDSLKSSWWSTRRSQQYELLENRVVEQGLACLEELVLVCVQLQLQSIEAQACAVIDRLTCFEHDLKQLERRIAMQKAAATEAKADAPTGYDVAFRNLLLEHRPRLVQELRREIDAEVLTGPRKLRRFLIPGSSLDHQLWEPLQQHARQIVLNSMRQVLLILLRHGKPTDDKMALNLDAVVESHLKEPLQIGRDGSRERAVVIVPTDESAGQLQRRLQRFEQHVTAVSAATNNVTVCREAEAVPVFQLAEQIALHQPVLMQLAENLASRTDVPWEPLTAPQGTSTVEPELNPVGEKISATVCLGEIDEIPPSET
jgi:hypothetical protein